jgi:O-antigen/teichoic acid export membrane protein
MLSESTTQRDRKVLMASRNEGAAVPGVEQDAGFTSSRSTVQLFAGRVFFMLSGYLITIILARNLGPAEYGVYGVVMSVLMWIEMLGSAGIPGATAKFVAQYESQTRVIEQTAMTLLLGISFILFLVCWSLGPAFTSLFNIQSGTMLFRIAILDIPLSGMYLAYQGILHGHRRFGTLSVGMIIYSLTKLLGISILWAIDLSVSGALLVNAAATLGVLIYFAGKLLPRVNLPQGGLASAIGRVALPMGLYLVALQMLLSLDLWLLKSLWTGAKEVIGIYVAALNVSKVMIVVPSVVSGVLFASLSWALAQKRETLAQDYIQGICRFAFIVIVPSCAFLALHAQELMVMLYSSAYATGGRYLALLLIAYGLLPFLDIFFHALMAADKRYLSAVILLILIPGMVLCNVVLIPFLGPSGAAVSLAIVMAVGTAISAALAYRRFGPLMRLSSVLRVMVATALVSFISAQISIAGPWLMLKLAAMLGVYALCLNLLAEIGAKDWQAIMLWRKGGQ